MSFSVLIESFPAWAPHFVFPENAIATEMFALRWLHFIFGITWIGLLYFFNLVGTPTMTRLEPLVRVKVYPLLMSRAMLWFRWSALITVAVGVRYFFHLLSVAAHNAGDSSLMMRWFWRWLLVWTLTYALIYALQLPATGILDRVIFRVVGIAAVVIAAAWLVLALNGGASVSNEHLAISVGGGLGWIMLLNTWGVVWRVQKALIRYARAAAESGAPMPDQAVRLQRWGFLTARTSFWLSFPMLFFMAAASHYPFLSVAPR
jgi:uncharacterized membrane protein